MSKRSLWSQQLMRHLHELHSIRYQSKQSLEMKTISNLIYWRSRTGWLSLILWLTGFSYYYSLLNRLTFLHVLNPVVFQGSKTSFEAAIVLHFHTRCVPPSVLLGTSSGEPLVKGRAALFSEAMHTPRAKNIEMVSKGHRCLKSALPSVSVRFYCNG